MRFDDLDGGIKMSNWCEGSITVRGKFKNLKRFCKEVFFVNEVKVINNLNLYEIETDDDECFFVQVHKNICIGEICQDYLQPCFIEFYKDMDHEILTLSMPFKAKRRIEAKPYIELSKKYDVNIKLYGFEKGCGFNQEIIVIDGELTRDEKIKFEDYSWDCAMPYLGG